MSVLDKMLHVFQHGKCIFCKHLSDKEEDRYRFACKAYPDGVPEEIVYAPTDEECGNGIKFEEED